MLVHVVNGRRDDWSCEMMEKKKKEEVDHLDWITLIILIMMKKKLKSLPVPEYCTRYNLQL